MTTLSLGLAVFAGTDVASKLVDSAANVIAWFVGGEGAFDKLMQLADNADRLEIGANALDRLAISIGRIGALKLKGDEIGIDKFAADLAKAANIIPVAIDGGSYDPSFKIGDQINVAKGLASADIGWVDAIKNITTLRKALSINPQTEEMRSQLLESFSLQSKQNEEMSERYNTLATNIAIQNSRIGDLTSDLREIFTGSNITINNINNTNNNTQNDGDTIIPNTSNSDEEGQNIED